MRLVNTNLNELNQQNNEQIKINKDIDTKMNLLIKQTNNMLHEMRVTSGVVADVEGWKLVKQIEDFTKYIDGLKLAISYVKVGLVNNDVLSNEDILNVRSLLLDQGIPIRITEEIFEFVDPKFALNNEWLYYIIDIPIYELHLSEIVMIQPLIVNNQIVLEYPTHLVLTEQGFFTTSKPDSFTQKFKNLVQYKDNCITTMIKGNGPNFCKTQLETSVYARVITDNYLLISNAKNDILYSNCTSEKKL